MGKILIKSFPLLASLRPSGALPNPLTGLRPTPSLRFAQRLPARAQGSVMGSVLVATMVAGVGVLALSSRVAESRFAGFTRSDSLTAREAAEFGLNEIQAKLNSSPFSYLLVTKRSSWGKNNLANDLNNCNVPVVDVDGIAIAPSVPPEVSTEREIKNSNGETITYRLVDYQPPSLPDDSLSLAQDMTRPGCDATAAANFGNLNGGSAIITVEGRIDRQGKISTFRLKRTTHVASPNSENTYSFMILGNAYKKSPKNVEPLKWNEFGGGSDVAELNLLQGNICYGKLSDTTCFTNPPLPKATIGCFDVRSCVLNNADRLPVDKLRQYCSDTVTVRKQSKQVGGFTCNEFEEIGGLPPMMTPTTSGVIINSTPYTDNHWLGASTKIDACEPKNHGTSTSPDWGWICDIKEIRGFNSDGSVASKSPDRNDLRVNFPYTKSGFDKITASNSYTALTNSDLVPGCYFNNFSINGAMSAISGNSTVINCLLRDLKIDNKGSTLAGLSNFVIHTTKSLSGTQTVSLAPVNLFFHGSDEILLDKGGIENSDKTDFGWSRLRLLGKAIPPNADGSISCDASSKIKSKKGNDLTNLFVWLPNGALDYGDRTASLDNSYIVAWVCRFKGPGGGNGNMYSIITPIPRNVALEGLARTIPGFTSTTDSTYRSYGAKDTPA